MQTGGIKQKILITTSTFAVGNKEPLQILEEQGFDVIKNPFGRRLNTKELIELLPGAVGLIAGLESLERKILEACSLKVISRCGAGLSNVDIKAAQNLGIKVFSTPDAPTDAVAELTVGAMLTLLRRIHDMNAAMHRKSWEKSLGFQLKNKVVCIVGFGRIGRRVAHLLKAFQAVCLAVDPYAEKCDHADVDMVDLSTGLKQADIITLHSSGEELILDSEQFSLMKSGAFLLNSGRGGLVNEHALCRALDENRLAGAWIDTFQTEPYVGSLTEYPQVILTPHVGSYTAECRQRMELEAVNNLIAGLRG